ncbi:MAG: hypothetical protein OEU32_15025 [Acidimicrobiia bacterium]|nr:hypothetical protein [Acidimicrobiia bacterium]
MFTTGFKLFFGFAIAALVGAAFYGVASGNLDGKDYVGFVDPAAFIGVITLGWKGGIGDHVGYVILVFFMLAAGFIGLTLMTFRDADPEEVAKLTEAGEIPAAAGPTQPNMWPAVGGFSVGVVMFGLVTHAAIFILGLVLLGMTAMEWMISAWADRATGDPAVNRELRTRIMAPFEVPILGAAGIAILVLSASRVFLAVSEANAVWLAVGVAAVIMVGAITVASVESTNKSMVTLMIAIGALAIISAGIVSAAVGQRSFEHEEDHSEELEENGAVVFEVGP